MPTVVDALIVTLGLDPKDFTKGQREAAKAAIQGQKDIEKAALAQEKAAVRAARETEKAAKQEAKAHRDALKQIEKDERAAAKEAERHAKEVARAHDQAADSLNRLGRNALKLFAIFTGGRAVGQFVTDIGKADAAMGRMADRLGVAPERIAAFDNAVKRAGGTAGEGSASFQQLSDTLNELRTSGNASALVPFARLQGISGQQIRLNGKLEESFGDLAEAAKGTAEKAGASTASFLLKQAGYSEATINLLLKGRKAVEEALSRSQKAGLVSKADSDAARALGEQYEDLSDRVTDFGRKISTALTPVITDLMKRFADWLDLNKDWLKDDIVGEVTKFATELRKIPWDDVGKGIRDFVKDANSAAQAVGGWTRVAEIFFGLWAASKVGQVLVGIAAIRNALVIGDTSLLAAMARVGLPVAIGAAAMGHGFQTPEEAAKDPDQAVLQKEGIDRRARVRGAIGGAWEATKRFGRRLIGGGGEDAGENGGMRTRARRGLDKLAQSANVKAITGELRNAGYGDNAIAAVVGSMETESTFNPRAHNDVSGGHTGLWQWDRNRWPKIKRWIEAQGGNPYDAAWQTKAWVAEHNSKPGDAIYDHPRTERGGAILRNNPTIEDAIHGVRESERFGPGEEGGRARHAREWLPQIRSSAQRDKDIATIQAGPRKPESNTLPNGAPAVLKPNSMPDAPGQTMNEANKRKPMASLLYGDTPPAARIGAAAVVAQASSAQADRLASISNDNRSVSTSTAESHFHGDMIFQNAGDSREIANNLRDRLKERQFVQAANYGQG
ncbi:hypothetical protein SAMN05216360_12948 [Methylobacterium phyllostachyos]|uniref:Phage tail lysozyme domain-containing protein n=1 Tax=Methylobacterium phyllostachyos TaxID=582672 RepID=A0A1H0KWQ8_9HYPH|nr:hypothetical protein SAMN05216360_12948 [Methylobacterium phyllostachyos]